MRGAKKSARLALVALALACTMAVAITATNIVPASSAGSSTPGAPTANQLKPSACAALNLATVVVGSGTFNGTNAANLLLGSAGVDTIRGLGGNDCLVGGAANDSLRGDGGTDVCVGGAGTDTFHASCETQIQ